MKPGTLNEVAIFVQARLGSSRLPRKVLADLGGRPVLAWALSALSSVPAAVRLVLTDEESADELRPVAVASGFGVFVGHPTDVLARFAAAVRSLRPRPRWIVRATGDNPLVAADRVLHVLKRTRDSGADVGFPEWLPRGMGFEVVKTEALLDAAENARLPGDREHVTPYIRRWRPAYHSYGVLSDDDLPPVTVDTEADLRHVRAVVRRAAESGLSALEVLREEAALAEMRLGE